MDYNFLIYLQFISFPHMVDMYDMKEHSLNIGTCIGE